MSAAIPDTATQSPFPETVATAGEAAVAPWVIWPPTDLDSDWSEQLGLSLGVDHEQLRFFTPAGERVPTPEESAMQAQQQLDAEQQRNAVLAAKLRELGIDPEALGPVTLG
ncbi:hypothetical protein [Trichothermofontia sp.]